MRFALLIFCLKDTSAPHFRAHRPWKACQWFSLWCHPRAVRGLQTPGQRWKSPGAGWPTWAEGSPPPQRGLEERRYLGTPSFFSWPPGNVPIISIFNKVDHLGKWLTWMQYHGIQSVYMLYGGPSKDARMRPLAGSFSAREGTSTSRTTDQPSHLKAVRCQCFCWKGVIWWTGPNYLWVPSSCCGGQN